MSKIPSTKLLHLYREMMNQKRPYIKLEQQSLAHLVFKFGVNTCQLPLLAEIPVCENRQGWGNVDPFSIICSLGKSRHVITSLHGGQLAGFVTASKQAKTGNLL